MTDTRDYPEISMEILESVSGYFDTLSAAARLYLQRSMHDAMARGQTFEQSSDLTMVPRIEKRGSEYLPKLREIWETC